MQWRIEQWDMSECVLSGSVSSDHIMQLPLAGSTCMNGSCILLSSALSQIELYYVSQIIPPTFPLAHIQSIHLMVNSRLSIIYTHAYALEVQHNACNRYFYIIISTPLATFCDEYIHLDDFILRCFSSLCSNLLDALKTMQAQE